VTLYLLNHLSTSELVALVVGGSVALAMLGVVLVRKLWPNIGQSSFEQMTEVVRADVFALLYSIVLGLVIADLSGNFSTASATVSAEASALNGIMRTSLAFPAEPSARFPDGPRAALQEALGAYVHAVVDDEFPRMRTGGSSPVAFATLEGVYSTVQAYEPKTNVQQAFYDSAVDELREATLNRRERLQDSESGTSNLLRTLLLAGGVVFILLAYPASIESLRVQAAIVGAATAFVSFGYLLTMVLDYPFAGDESVSTTPYKTGPLASLWALESPPRPLESGQFGRLTPAELVGVWNSQVGFGTMVFRRAGTEIRGVYRADRGTFVGRLGPDGVLRGWWCQEASRRPPSYAGEAEWRLLSTRSTSTTLDGRWRGGVRGRIYGGWDLQKVDIAEPPDLAARFPQSGDFCRHP
jgi:hypothetical protein